MDLIQLLGILAGFAVLILITDKGWSVYLASFAGAVAVILLLSIGEGWWALGAGVLAAALFLLAVWDPARVLKKRTRPESRLDVKSRE